MKGLYIAFEGIVGTGKTTKSRKLCEYLNNEFPERKVIFTREPGGSKIAEKIRKVVQGTNFKEKMEAVCEAYLYAASRAQTLRRIVRPVLQEGGIVISDRCFISSIAYQGFARNLGYERVMEINKAAIDGIIPDAIIYMDMDPEIGLRRTFDKRGDKFENEDIEFFRKIDKGYKNIASLPEFRKRWILINGNTGIEEVFSEIKEKLHLILASSR